MYLNISRWALAISAAKTEVIDAKSTISGLLNSVNEAGELCAKLLGSGDYVKGDLVPLGEQRNYIGLLGLDENDTVDASRFPHLVQQRSQPWKSLRQNVAATGMPNYLFIFSCFFHRPDFCCPDNMYRMDTQYVFHPQFARILMHRNIYHIHTRR